jgi:outer membrane protein
MNSFLLDLSYWGIRIVNGQANLYRMKKYFNLSTKLSPLGFILITLTTSFASFASIARNSAPNLKDLLNAAEQLNPTLQIQALSVSQSEQDLAIARSAVYPRINLNSNYTKQDDGGGSLIRTNQRSTFLQLRQPIYQGGREFAGLDSASYRIQAEKAEQQITKIEVSQNLAILYFELSKQTEVLKLNKELEKLSKDRVQFLQQRVQIGRARGSELVAAQAQLFSVESQIENNHQLLKDVENRIFLLTQVKAPYATQDLSLVWNLKAREAYSLKRDSSPFQLKSNFDLQIAKLEVDSFRANHKPSLDFSANYYLEREGVFNRAEWDLSFNLTFPLFQGGQTVSEVKRSLLKERVSLLDQEQIQRNLAVEIENFYNAAETGYKQSVKLKQAVELGLKNYRQTLREYDLSLVNNLEVIQAMNLYIQYKKDYIITHFIAWSNLTQLELLTGNE